VQKQLKDVVTCSDSRALPFILDVKNDNTQ
jgi:hypothetical protein